MKITTTTFICILFSIILSAQNFDKLALFDTAAQQDALLQIAQLKMQNGTPYSTEAQPAYETILAYQIRRCDPDSILLAAQNLLKVTPENSSASLFALYSIAESHLRVLDESKYHKFFKILEGKEAIVSSDIRPLLDFYLFALKGKYEISIGENYEKAIIFYSSALEMKHLYQEMIPDLIKDICYAFKCLGQYESIRSYLKEYKKLVKPSLIDNLDKMKYECDISFIHIALENYSYAVNAQKKVVKSLDAYATDLAYLTAEAYILLGEASYYIDRDEACKKAIEKAIEYKDCPEYRLWYMAVLYHLGEYDAALFQIQEKLKEQYQDFSPTDILENPSIDSKSLNLGIVTYALWWKSRTLYKKSILEDKDTAIKMLESSIEVGEIARKNYNKILFGVDGYTMSQYIINRSNIFGIGYQMRAAYQLSLRRGEEDDLKILFKYMEMRKNFMLSEAFSLDYLPKDLREERQNRMRDIEVSSFKFLHSSPDSTDFHLKTLLRKSIELDKHIAAAKQSYENPIQDQADLKIADPDVIQAGLDDKTIFIQYAYQWQHGYMYVITSEKQFVIKHMIYEEYDKTQDKLEKLIKLLQSPLQTQKIKLEKFIDLSHALYEKLIQPIEKELIGKEKIIIVPERDLCHLPFEVLLKSGEKKSYSDLDYLLNDYEISYQPSGTYYERFNNKTSVEDGSFLGFAPVFNEGQSLSDAAYSRTLFSRKTNNRSIKGENFLPLPGTKEEISTIASFLPTDSSAKLLLNQSATRANLGIELAKPYQYVHIATHGLVNFYDPRFSAIACYSPDNISNKFYFSHQIEMLRLQTDLVVLSSCDSGIGRIHEGENMFAVSRSFLAAGAKNILYSLWKINDKYSSDLMIDFYRHHLKNKSYTSALRHAKLNMLSQPATAAPRYWAPFILTGG